MLQAQPRHPLLMQQGYAVPTADADKCPVVRTVGIRSQLGTYSSNQLSPGLSVCRFNN